MVVCLDHKGRCAGTVRSGALGPYRAVRWDRTERCVGTNTELCVGTNTERCIGTNTERCVGANAEQCVGKNTERCWEK